MNGAEWLMLDRVGFQTAWLLLSALWQSSILLAAAGLLAYALRRRRSSVRHAILVAAILASPLIPLLGWAVSRSGTPQAPIPVMPTYSAAARPAQAAPPVVLPPEAVTAPPVLAQAPADPEIDHAHAAQPEKAQPQEKPFSLLDYPWALALLAYAGGAMSLLCLVAVGTYRIARWARRGRAVTDPRVLVIFRAAGGRLPLDRDVALVESRRVLSPMTVGTLHPVILLPAGLAQDSSDEDLLAIALHELTHVRRCDSLLLTLLSLVRAVLFFHPLVWLACRQASNLAEGACDDAVLDATGEPVSYAKMLARLAERLPRHALGTELAVGIVLSNNAFLRRIQAILSDRRDRFRRLSRQAMLVTVSAAVLSVVIALALPLGEKNGGESASQPATHPATRAATTTTSAPATPATDAAQIDRLIKQLGSDKFAERDATQEALLKIGLPAVAALQSATVDKDPERAARAKVVVQSIEEQVVAAASAQWGNLAQGPVSPSELARRRSVMAALEKGLLRATSDAARLKVMVDAATAEPASDTRAAMIRRAGQLARGVQEDFLLDRLKNDPDFFMRQSAAVGLGQIGSEASADALIAAAQSDRSTPGLMGDVGSSAGTCRRAAMFALAELAGRHGKIAPRIALALRDLPLTYDPKDNEHLYDARLQALYQITGEAKLLEPFYQSLKSPDARERENGVIAFRFLKLRKAPAELVERLRDQDGQVQSWTAMVLGEIGDLAAAEALARVATDAKANIYARANAVASLGQLRAQAAVPALEGLIEVREGNIGDHAKRALELIRSSATMPDTQPGTQPAAAPAVSADAPDWAKAVVAAMPAWELERLDAAPSVTVGDRQGLRLILRQGQKEYLDLQPKQQERYSDQELRSAKFVMRYRHAEFVVFPGGALPSGGAGKIGWTEWEGELPYFKKPVHMGAGMGMAWYANATIYDQERLRQALKLQDGDDRLALLTEAMLVQDQGTVTRNSCVQLLAAAGDKAIPYIKSAVEGQKDGRQAIGALAFIQTDAATEYLKTLYQAEPTRLAAELALIYEPFRKPAKGQYLDMLQRRRYIFQTAEASVQFAWKEAIPLLDAVYKQPPSIGEFAAVFEAKRMLEGRPVPDEIDQAQQQLRQWVYSKEPPTKQELAGAKAALLGSKDTEAAAVVAIGLTTAMFKASNDRLEPVQQIGREILRELPRKETAQIVERLAKSLAQVRSEERTSKQLLEILSSDSDPPSTPAGTPPPGLPGFPPSVPPATPVPSPTAPAPSAPSTGSGQAGSGLSTQPGTQRDDGGWGKPGTNGLRIRLLLASQGESRPILTPDQVAASLEVWNTGDKPIKIAEQNNTGGREMMVDEWLIGLKMQALDASHGGRTFFRADNQDEYWASVEKFNGGARDIPPGGKAMFKVRLHRLVDREGTNLLSLRGDYELQPVLEILGYGGNLWRGSAVGNPVWVQIYASTATGPARPTTSAPATQAADGGGGEPGKATITKVYDVRDLIFPIESYEPPPVWAPAQKAPQDEPAESAQTAPAEVGLTQELVKTLQEQVDPKSWQGSGAVGSIRELQGMLVVTQTAKNQERLGIILQQLREGRSLQVRVKGQFIVMSSKQDQAMRKWLAENVKGEQLDEKTGAMFLSVNQAGAMYEKAYPNLDVHVLAAPCLTIFNGKRACISVATEQALGVSLLDKQGKVDVKFLEGAVLDIQPTVSADKKHVNLTLRPIFSKLLSKDALPRFSQALTDLTVSMPNKGTLLVRLPFAQRKVRGAVEKVSEKGAKTIEMVSAPADANATPQEYLYFLVEPTIIEQREVEEKNAFPDGPASQPATRPAPSTPSAPSTSSGQAGSGPSTQPAGTDAQSKPLAAMLVGAWTERSNPRRLIFSRDGTFQMFQVEPYKEPSLLLAGSWELQGRNLRRRIEQSPENASRVGQEQLLELKAVTEGSLELFTPGGFGPFWLYDRAEDAPRDSTTQPAMSEAVVRLDQDSPWGQVANGLQSRLLPLVQTTQPTDGHPDRLTVYLYFELRNVSGKGLFFQKPGTPFDMNGDVFGVTVPDGKTVRYTGVWAARGPLTEKDFIWLNANESMARRVGLPYDFSKPGVYSISASTTHAAGDAAKVFQGDALDLVWSGTFKSNTVTVNIAPAAATQPATQPAGRKVLPPGDLSGNWEGELDGVKARIEFFGHEDATWRIQVPQATLIADLKRIEGQQPGTFDLRVDYVTGPARQRGSAVIGRLEQTGSGNVALSVLPAAAQLDSDYQTILRIPLQKTTPATSFRPAFKPASQPATSIHSGPATQPAVGQAEAEFGSFSVEMKSFWAWNRTLTVKSDGTYTFQMQTLEKAPGQKQLQPGKTPYIAGYRLSPGDLRELTQLLKATEWLSAPASTHPVATDSTECAMALSRDGKLAQRTYHDGDKVQAYVDLVRFLRRINRQEDLLFAVTHRDQPFPGDANLGEELDAVLGVGSTIKPYAPVLDYHRLVPAYAEFLAKPGQSPRLAADAAKLMGYLKLESQRKNLESLALGRAADDPAYAVPGDLSRSAVNALAMMGAAQSLEVLKTAGQAKDLRDAVAEALLGVPSDKAIPILKDMASGSQNAAWALIRLGRQAQPAIVDLLYQPGNEDAGGRAGYFLIRAYSDHWKELAAPPEAKVLSAIHDKVRSVAGSDGSLIGKYGLEVLKLADDPFVVGNAWQDLEATLSLMGQKDQEARKKLLLPMHFRSNRAPVAFLNDAQAGNLGIRRVMAEGASGWAHVADPKGETNYGLNLSRNGVVWVIEAAQAVPGDGVQNHLNGFLRRCPQAKEVQADASSPDADLTARNDEAVGRVVERIMTAFRDKDVEALKRLSAGSALGWLSPQEAKDLPARLPAGWSAQRLGEVVKELHDAYAANPNLMRDVQSLQVKGDWAGAHLTGPEGKLAGPGLIVILNRTPQGWRLLDVGEPKGALPEDLERRAGQLAQMRDQFLHARAVQAKDAAIAKQAGTAGSSTQPATSTPSTGSGQASLGQAGSGLSTQPAAE